MAPTTTPEGILDEHNVFIDAIFLILNEVKPSNQQINTIIEETNTK